MIRAARLLNVRRMRRQPHTQGADVHARGRLHVDDVQCVRPGEQALRDRQWEDHDATCTDGVEAIRRRSAGHRQTAEVGADLTTGTQAAGQGRRHERLCRVRRRRQRVRVAAEASHERLDAAVDAEGEDPDVLLRRRRGVAVRHGLDHRNASGDTGRPVHDVQHAFVEPAPRRGADDPQRRRPGERATGP